ncbi:MAG: hypothetical protein JOS17DRAFT_3808 [Linnemannia elongata]|nr:MAG: hypothetical protein JOS17DRAFT_3808 [Linnemannia elongata]
MRIGGRCRRVRIDFVLSLLCLFVRLRDQPFFVYAANGLFLTPLTLSLTELNPFLNPTYVNTPCSLIIALSPIQFNCSIILYLFVCLRLCTRYLRSKGQCVKESKQGG